MGLEHGTFLVDEHLVRIGDDGGCDVQCFLHKVDALANGSRPGTTVKSEV